MAITRLVKRLLLSYVIPVVNFMPRRADIWRLTEPNEDGLTAHTSRTQTLVICFLQYCIQCAAMFWRPSEA